jgi:hypothetical protein
MHLTYAKPIAPLRVGTIGSFIGHRWHGFGFFWHNFGDKKAFTEGVKATQFCCERGEIKRPGIQVLI